MSANEKLTRSVLIVMLTTLLSRLIGFIREMLLPNMLGVGIETDAYLNAYMFPDLMYSLLMGGAIAAALIPILSGYIDTDNEKEGWLAVSTFVNVILMVMIFICLMGMIFSPQLMKLLISESSKEETRVLSAHLARILFPSVAFLMLSGILNGVLNAHRRFASAMLGPIIYNIGNSFAIYFLSPYGVEKIAYGVMASSVIYFLIQLSFTKKNLKYYKLGLHFGFDGSKRIFRLAIPSFISASVVQINIMISAKFANLFEEGRMTAFKIADKTWQMPYGIFAVSLGIALLPTLSGLFAKKNIEDFSALLTKSIKSVLILAMPCSIAIVILNERIIRSLFQFSSNFKEQDVTLTSQVLIFFSIALVTQSIVAIINRGFYASHDTKTPLIIGTITIVWNLLLSYIFYKYTNMDVYGIALSYSLASLSNAILLLLFMKRKIKYFKIKDITIFISKLIPAFLIMGVCVFFINKIDISNAISKLAYAKLVDVAYLVLIAIIGAVIYFATIIFCKIEEGILVYNRLCDRFKLTKLKINGNL